MDRNLREMTECGEGRSGEASGGERLSEGAVQMALHAGGCEYGVLQGVEDGPVFRAHIKCDEVTCPIVP